MTIRQCYAVWQNEGTAGNAGKLVDHYATGPAITAGLTTGQVGDAIDIGFGASEDTTVGASFAGDFSLSMRVNIAAGGRTADDTIAAFTIVKSEDQYRVDVYSEADDTFTISAGAASHNMALANGWHSIGMRVSSGQVQIIVDGVDVGSSAAYSPADATGQIDRVFSFSDYSLIEQLVLAVFAMTAAEQGYIHNSGSGRDVATWELTAGGGAGAIQQRKRLLLLEGQSA